MNTSHKDPKVQALRRLSALGGCSEKQLQLIAGLTTTAWLPAGRTLMKQGDVGRECFIVVEGEVSVCKEGREVAVLGPGSVVGEMALIARHPRSATVTTLTPMTCQVLTAGELNVVLDIGPVARRIAEALATRLV